MALVRNFKASTSLPNQIALNWKQPLGFNNSNDEIIITRTSNHFPMELFNDSFPDKATDPRGIEIFRGSTIVGLNSGTISVISNTLTDSAATFPNLTGRLLRDKTSKVFTILSNTSTSVTLNAAPTNGKYAVLADFPTVIRPQQNFEVDARTVFALGSVSNLVEMINGSLLLVKFEPDELVNLVFNDGAGSRFIVKSNTADTVYFFESSTPVSGVGMSLLNSFNSSSPSPYIDNFKIISEATSKIGTGLLDDTFYYYTSFNLPIGANVAQAEFAVYTSGTPTQDTAISTKDKQFGDLLYNSFWPTIYRSLDTTGDLEDLMKVFGFQFNELHSLIATYRLQDTDRVFVNALLPLSEQFGLPSVGYSIGSDTLRRIAERMISCWKLKGSKEGIAEFIRVITTWDITNGTGNFAGSISDFLPNVSALRLFDPNLGITNVRLTETDPLVSGGRFAKTLPGIVIPGFFTFREFVVTIPNVALYVGASQSFSLNSNTTTLVDNLNNFGPTDSLIGNFLLPNQEEVNDIFQIVANTSTSITVKGIINSRNPGGEYAVLSPLNANRFIILNKLLPNYIPYGTKAGFSFI